MARFEKDFRHLCRQIDSLSNGQARVSADNIFQPTKVSSRTSISSDSSSDSEDSSSSQTFYIEITPHDGPYAHASYIFRIQASGENEYSDCAPNVSCLTRIYHPNIDTTYQNRYNNVCVSTLSEWNSETNSTFEDLLQGLLFLFHSPNPDDPLTANVANDEKEFVKNVRIGIEGGFIEDFDYDSFDMNYGYKRYLDEQEKQQNDQGEKLDDHLVDLLTRQPNFKRIFNIDTIDLLMNDTAASAVSHGTRHNKDTPTNS